MMMVMMKQTRAIDPPSSSTVGRPGSAGEGCEGCDHIPNCSKGRQTRMQSSDEGCEREGARFRVVVQ